MLFPFVRHCNCQERGLIPNCAPFQQSLFVAQINARVSTVIWHEMICAAYTLQDAYSSQVHIQAQQELERHSLEYDLVILETSKIHKNGGT